MRTCGCIPSKKNSYPEFRLTTRTNLFPSYSVASKLGGVIDQGSTPKCVSIALTDLIEYNQLVKGKKVKHKDSYFFDNRQDKSQKGMSVLEALEFLKSKGYNGVVLTKAARVGSIELLKYAIVNNGPAIICLPVYDSSRLDFWNGNKLEGYHALLAVGYDDKNQGLILRNSWGTSYGNNGYVNMSYSDFNKVVECWTILD